MEKVYIAAAKRTAIGKFDGTLKNVGAVDLGTVVVKQLLAESGIDANALNEVIFGNVLSAGLGQNVTRQIAIKTGCDFTIPSFTSSSTLPSSRAA